MTKTSSQRARQRLRVRAFRLRDQIAELSRSGKTDEQIALIVCLPAARVATERTRMGIPPGGTSQDANWRPAEDTEILEQRNRRGRFWVAIAEELHAKFHTTHTPNDVRYRYELLTRLALQRSKNGHKQIRQCMTCGEDFVSEGIHDRICDDCEGSQRPFDIDAPAIVGIDFHFVSDTRGKRTFRYKGVR